MIVCQRTTQLKLNYIGKHLHTIFTLYSDIPRSLGHRSVTYSDSRGIFPISQNNGIHILFHLANRGIIMKFYTSITYIYGSL